jgi:hypothetical protein
LIFKFGHLDEADRRIRRSGSCERLGNVLGFQTVCACSAAEPKVHTANVVCVAGLPRLRKMSPILEAPIPDTWGHRTKDAPNGAQKGLTDSPDH